MAKNQYKEKQIRKTLEDTINFQIELSELIEKKIDENLPLNSIEKERFRYIFPRAVLSQGLYEIKFKNKDGRMSKFRHLSMLANLLRKLNSPIAILIDNQSNTKYELLIQDLWEFFDNQLEVVYPYAREQAVRMSAEAPVREPPSAYKFSAKQ